MTERYLLQSGAEWIAERCAACRYDVMFVENVTDIDDKIILRTHKNRASAVLAAVRTTARPRASPDPSSEGRNCISAHRTICSDSARPLPQGEAALPKISGPSKDAASSAVAALKALVDADSKAIALLAEASKLVVSTVTCARLFFFPPTHGRRPIRLFSPTRHSVSPLHSRHPLSPRVCPPPLARTPPQRRPRARRVPG